MSFLDSFGSSPIQIQKLEAWTNNGGSIIYNILEAHDSMLFGLP